MQLHWERVVMPKRVDHEQRRRHIAEAVWVIAATRGLEAATLRDVAAQAEVSMGMVQHYFGIKDELLRFACRHLVELAEEGMRTLVAGEAAPASPRSVIRSLALQSLPLDDQQRAGAGVWYAFLVRAVHDPHLAACVREAWEGAHAVVTEELRAGQQAGEVSGAVDVGLAADALLGLVDGLVSHLLVRHHTGEQAIALVDAHLDQLFT